MITFEPTLSHAALSETVARSELLALYPKQLESRLFLKS